MFLFKTSKKEYHLQFSEYKYSIAMGIDDKDEMGLSHVYATLGHPITESDLAGMQYAVLSQMAEKGIKVKENSYPIPLNIFLISKSFKLGIRVYETKNEERDDRKLQE